MKKCLLLACLLPLALVACGSGEVGPGGGNLRATANAGGTAYTFDCDPAKQTTSTISIGNSFALTCPSSDRKASLTVLVNQAPTTDGKSTKYVLNAVLTAFGTPNTTYTASGDLVGYTVVGRQSFSADFDVRGVNALRVSGHFDLSAQ